MELLDEIYEVVKIYPPSELYNFVLQMKKAALSIPSNLAEGCGRYTPADQRHFYREANASGHELETQIQASISQKFITKVRGDELIAKTQEVGRLINGLIRKLNKKSP